MLIYLRYTQKQTTLLRQSSYLPTVAVVIATITLTSKTSAAHDLWHILIPILGLLHSQLVSAHALSRQTRGVLRCAELLAKGLSLCPLCEYAHIHVPGASAPLRPYTVILVLTTAIRVNQ
jgi:hypothetical protein